MSSPVPIALSIVIPAFNEAGRLPMNLARVSAHCAGLDLAPFGTGWEVLAMVEKSPDGTLEKARAAATGLAGIEVIDNQVQRGKGYAVRSGMLRAKGEIVFFMDADLSTPLGQLDLFLQYFAAHPEVDILIGNRRHPASRISKPEGLVRRILSDVFGALVRRQALAGPWLDTQCGFKAFRRPAARAIFTRQQLDGFSFDVEVLALAEALHLRVADLPVEWHHDDATRLRLLQDGWGMLRDMRRVRALVAKSAL
jgi:glycosyltransferase involved in cell wall biosynthesis